MQNKRIAELCSLITAEKDSKKLIPLIDELRKLLTDEKVKLEASLKKNFSN